MPKIYNIICYFFNPDYYSYGIKSNNIKVWEGKIIVNDKGWFEGIINYKDKDNEINKELFIYGVFVANIGIKIVESVPYRIGSRLRQISLGTYIIDGEYYNGIKKTGTDKSQKTDGNYMFSITEELSDKETLTNFLKALENVRNRIYFYNFYLNTYKNKTNLMEKIKVIQKSIIDTKLFLSDGIKPVFDNSVNLLGGNSYIKTGKKRTK